MESSIAEQLRKQHLKPRKGIGQHYLVDEEAVAAVISAVPVTSADTVVEVGPGPGVLTPQLCALAKQVIAVELDEKILPTLATNTALCTNLEVRQGDILQLDLASLPQPYHLVGNVPYYITSAILQHFLSTQHKPASLTVTIQAEVAERIVARPPRMSILALSVQLYGTPEIAHRIPKAAFWPAPKVDSAVLTIINIGQHTHELLDDLPESTFFKVVRAGFAEKRKQLHNSLARNLNLAHDQTTNLLHDCGIEPSRRAETLTLVEWVELGKTYVARS